MYARHGPRAVRLPSHAGPARSSAAARSGDGAAVPSAGPPRARRGPRGAKEEPPRHRAARTPRPDNGRAEARRCSRLGNHPGTSGRGGLGERCCWDARRGGRAAWRRAGSCRSRLEFSTRLPPSPCNHCQAGLLPAAASCRAGDPRWGRGGQEDVFPALCGGGRGRGGAARRVEAGGGGVASASRFPI